MRPVNKGRDLGDFSPYNNAQQPLISRLGENCSYCERWIAGGIHVEHKKPKGKYPNLKLKWTNFLLACGNCNSSKGSDRLNLVDYVWPDSENTLRAFKYESEGRILPSTGFGGILDQRIEDTWKLLGLNRHPDSTVAGFVIPTAKDKRWVHRKVEWQKATDNKARLLRNDTVDFREMVVDIAVSRGMFSIWYTVFSDDKDMKSRLILRFDNTERLCFDDEYDPIARPNGQI
ncbi:HNH endonuclease [Colwelliaceae bacterium BS250]